MLGRLARQHEHHLVFGSGLRAYDCEISEPIREDLLVLSTLANACPEQRPEAPST
jgi:hypothetical protein